MDIKRPASYGGWRMTGRHWERPEFGSMSPPALSSRCPHTYYHHQPLLVNPKHCGDFSMSKAKLPLPQYKSFAGEAMDLNNGADWLALGDYLAERDRRLGFAPLRYRDRRW